MNSDPYESMNHMNSAGVQHILEYIIRIRSFKVKYNFGRSRYALLL